MNRENLQYRHELKYILSNGESLQLENRIRHLLLHDIHVGTSDSYRIRSLYFDDYENRCFYENENGTDPREKFRIRIYNHSTDRIMLECKRKECGKTLKKSCPLTVEQTRSLMEGNILPNIEQQSPLLRKLTMQMLTRYLRPVVIVEYDRVPYVYSNGNVRITFDKNVSSSYQVDRFLEERIVKRPILPVGQMLLEVKFDQYLPDFIHHNLQLHSLQQTAFSKYYLCRKFIR